MSKQWRQDTPQDFCYLSFNEVKKLKVRFYSISDQNLLLWMDEDFILHEIVIDHLYISSGDCDC